MRVLFFDFEVAAFSLDITAAIFSLRLRAYSAGVIGCGFSFFPFPFLFSADCFVVFWSGLLVTVMRLFTAGAGEPTGEDGDEET
jgi:hypothetical protein